jgi:hypothetical protein
MTYTYCSRQVNPPYGYSSPGGNVTSIQALGVDKVYGDTTIHGEYYWLTFCRFILGVGVGGV